MDIMNRKSYILQFMYYSRHGQSAALGGDSQNFLGKFVRFFITVGLKILRLFRL